MPKSVKYFLNPVTGLIEPVFFDGHTNSSRGLDNYNFYQLLNSPKDNNTCLYICDPKDNFYRNFFGTYSNPNIKFYAKYIRNLERITEEEYFKNNIYPVWESLRIERGSLYKEFWRIDRIHNPGIMPHIAPWELIQKRLNTMRTNLKKANSIKPEILIKNKNNIIGIRNKFSDVPQIINLKCLDNNFETGDIVLPKNKFIDFTNNQINECNKNRIIYSMDDFNSVNNLEQGYLTDYEINEVNNFSKLGYVPKKDSSKNKITFKKEIIILKII